MDNYVATPQQIQNKVNAGQNLSVDEQYTAQKYHWTNVNMPIASYHSAGASHYKEYIRRQNFEIRKLKDKLGNKFLKQATKTKIEKQIGIKQTSITKAQRKYHDADSKAHYKMLRDKYSKQRTATLSNLKSDDRYDNMSYLMPNNPHTDHSYRFLYLTEESNPHSNNVSSVTPERGMSRTTTTQQNAPTVSLTGILGMTMDQGVAKDRDDAMEAMKQIQYWADTASDMCYGGEQYYPSCVISDFSPTYSLGSDGSVNTISFSLTLTITSYFNDTASKKQGKAPHRGRKNKKSGKKTNQKNRKHFVNTKNGESYTTIARKKGASFSSIESKNKYSSNKVPTGSKVYY